MCLCYFSGYTIMSSPTPKYYIICSHSNRVVDILKEYGVNYQKSTNRTKPNNCAILDFEFAGENKCIRITEIYDGQTQNSILLLDDNPNKLTTNTHIYVIRHAEGIHNEGKWAAIKAKLSSKYTDPLLTEKGIQQSNTAGKWFGSYLEQNTTITISQLFVSSLLRTHYTLYYFMTALFTSNTQCTNRFPIVKQVPPEKEPSQSTIQTTFIVLPNSEEVSKFNFGYENTSKCKTKKECIVDITINPSLKVSIDWRLFQLHTNMFGHILDNEMKCKPFEVSPIQPYNIEPTPNDTVFGFANSNTHYNGLLLNRVNYLESKQNGSKRNDSKMGSGGKRPIPSKKSRKQKKRQSRKSNRTRSYFHK